MAVLGCQLQGEENGPLSSGEESLTVKGEEAGRVCLLLLVSEGQAGARARCCLWRWRWELWVQLLALG